MQEWVGDKNKAKQGASIWRYGINCWSERTGVGRRMIEWMFVTKSLNKLRFRGMSMESVGLRLSKLFVTFISGSQSKGCQEMNFMAWVRERTITTERPPTVGEVSANTWSVWHPYCLILDFLDRNRYFFFQVAPQLYSCDWVDPVPDPLLRKSGSAGNRTQTSGTVARNFDY
jgi:hypothetical protein